MDFLKYIFGRRSHQVHQATARSTNQEESLINISPFNVASEPSAPMPGTFSSLENATIAPVPEPVACPPNTTAALDAAAPRTSAEHAENKTSTSLRNTAALDAAPPTRADHTANETTNSPDVVDPAPSPPKSVTQSGHHLPTAPAPVTGRRTALAAKLADAARRRDKGPTRSNGRSNVAARGGLRIGRPLSPQITSSTGLQNALNTKQAAPMRIPQEHLHELLRGKEAVHNATRIDRREEPMSSGRNDTGSILDKRTREDQSEYEAMVKRSKQKPSQDRTSEILASARATMAQQKLGHNHTLAKAPAPLSLSSARVISDQYNALVDNRHEILQLKQRNKFLEQEAMNARALRGQQWYESENEALQLRLDRLQRDYNQVHSEKGQALLDKEQAVADGKRKAESLEQELEAYKREAAQDQRELQTQKDALEAEKQQLEQERERFESERLRVTELGKRSNTVPPATGSMQPGLATTPVAEADDNQDEVQTHPAPHQGDASSVEVSELDNASTDSTHSASEPSKSTAGPNSANGQTEIGRGPTAPNSKAISPEMPNSHLASETVKVSSPAGSSDNDSAAAGTPKVVNDHSKSLGATVPDATVSNASLAADAAAVAAHSTVASPGKLGGSITDSERGLDVSEKSKKVLKNGEDKPLHDDDDVNSKPEQEDPRRDAINKLNIPEPFIAQAVKSGEITDVDEVVALCLSRSTIWMSLQDWYYAYLYMDDAEADTYADMMQWKKGYYGEWERGWIYVDGKRLTGDRLRSQKAGVLALLAKHPFPASAGLSSERKTDHINYVLHSVFRVAPRPYQSSSKAPSRKAENVVGAQLAPPPSVASHFAQSLCSNTGRAPQAENKRASPTSVSCVDGLAEQEPTVALTKVDQGPVKTEKDHRHERERSSSMAKVNPFDHKLGKYAVSPAGGRQEMARRQETFASLPQKPDDSRKNQPSSVPELGNGTEEVLYKGTAYECIKPRSLPQPASLESIFNQSPITRSPVEPRLSPERADGLTERGSASNPASRKRPRAEVTCHALQNERELDRMIKEEDEAIEKGFDPPTEPAAFRKAKRQKLEEEGISPPRINRNRHHPMALGSRLGQDRRLYGPKGDIVRHLNSNSLRGGNVEERGRKRERMKVDEECYPELKAKRSRIVAPEEEVEHEDTGENAASPKRMRDSCTDFDDEAMRDADNSHDDMNYDGFDNRPAGPGYALSAASSGNAFTSGSFVQDHAAGSSAMDLDEEHNLIRDGSTVVHDAMDYVPGSDVDHAVSATLAANTVVTSMPESDAGHAQPTAHISSPAADPQANSWISFSIQASSMDSERPLNDLERYIKGGINYVRPRSPEIERASRVMDIDENYSDPDPEEEQLKEGIKNLEERIEDMNVKTAPVGDMADSALAESLELWQQDSRPNDHTVGASSNVYKHMKSGTSSGGVQKRHKKSTATPTVLKNVPTGMLTSLSTKKSTSMPTKFDGAQFSITQDQRRMEAAAAKAAAKAAAAKKAEEEETEARYIDAHWKEIWKAKAEKAAKAAKARQKALDEAAKEEAVMDDLTSQFLSSQRL